MSQTGIYYKDVYLNYSTLHVAVADCVLSIDRGSDVATATSDPDPDYTVTLAFHLLKRNTSHVDYYRPDNHESHHIFVSGSYLDHWMSLRQYRHDYVYRGGNHSIARVSHK